MYIPTKGHVSLSRYMPHMKTQKKTDNFKVRVLEDFKGLILVSSMQLRFESFHKFNSLKLKRLK